VTDEAKQCGMVPRHGPTPANVGHILHELAHAWDNVRDGKLRSVKDMLKDADPQKAFAEEHTRTGATNWTDSATKHRTKDENGKAVNMTMGEMLDAYNKRPALRADRFGTPGTRPGYSQRSVADFYAEGFAVFHSGDEDQRFKLKALAPELFHLLEQEAKAVRP
jgi:hypothetical protein